jgi:glutathione S-transferase
MINESKVIMEFADEAYPDQGYSLLPKDPVERAKMRLDFPIAD